MPSKIIPAQAENSSSPLLASMAIKLQKAELESQFQAARDYRRALSNVKDRILSLATLDKETATECIYALPRGGKILKGPSIRFAEIIKAAYGNCRVAARVVEVNKQEGYLEAEAIFHDLETNAVELERVRRPIKHKAGQLYNDDMINVTSNAACSVARRNAILKSIPKPLWREAYALCEKAAAGNQKTLAESRKAAIAALANYGLSEAKLLEILEVTGVEDITLAHVETLRGLYAGLGNGEITLEDIGNQQTSSVRKMHSPTPMLEGALDD